MPPKFKLYHQKNGERRQRKLKEVQIQKENAESCNNENNAANEDDFSQLSIYQVVGVSKFFQIHQHR